MRMRIAYLYVQRMQHTSSRVPTYNNYLPTRMTCLFVIFREDSTYHFTHSNWSYVDVISSQLERSRQHVNITSIEHAPRKFVKRSDGIVHIFFLMDRVWNVNLQHIWPINVIRKLVVQYRTCSDIWQYDWYGSSIIKSYTQCNFVIDIAMQAFDNGKV